MSTVLSEKAKSVKPSSTLSITAKAKELRSQGIDVVGFGAGEPDFNTPDNVCDAAIKAINDGFTKYTPVSGIAELKQALSKKFAEFNKVNYTPDQIVISNGGKHSLTNVFTAILNPGDEVIIPAPYWLSYPEMIKLCDGKPVIVNAKKENEYKPTIEELEAALTEKTKALVLNTPNNPTGMIYTREELQKIADFAVKNDIFVVSDEMYEYLIYDGNEHVSIASLGDEIYKRTITVCGVSKSYAMTGWRIGYTGAPLEISKLMSSVQSHQASNPNSIAQKAAYEAIVGTQEPLKEMVKEFGERREYMYERICNMPYISCVEPKGAFYTFVDFEEVIGKEHKGRKITSAADIADILIHEYNTAVIPCDDFGIENHIRLSYAISMEQIKNGLDRIEAFLNNLE